MLLTAEKIGEDRSELGIWEIRVDGTTRESLRFGKGNTLSSSITFEEVGNLPRWRIRRGPIEGGGDG